MAELDGCSHALLYLDGRTWTSGEERSEALARELVAAMTATGVSLVLAHEMPGLGQTAYAVPFHTFISCPEGATPPSLLRAGLYGQVAVPLKAGPWRPAGLALLRKALVAAPAASAPAQAADAAQTAAASPLVALWAASGTVWAWMGRQIRVVVPRPQEELLHAPGDVELDDRLGGPSNSTKV